MSASSCSSGSPGLGLAHSGSSSKKAMSQIMKKRGRRRRFREVSSPVRGMELGAVHSLISGSSQQRAASGSLTIQTTTGAAGGQNKKINQEGSREHAAAATATAATRTRTRRLLRPRPRALRGGRRQSASATRGGSRRRPPQPAPPRRSGRPSPPSRSPSRLWRPPTCRPGSGGRRGCGCTRRRRRGWRVTVLTSRTGSRRS